MRDRSWSRKSLAGPAGSRRSSFSPASRSTMDVHQQPFYRNASNLNSILLSADLINNNSSNNNTSSSTEDDSENDNNTGWNRRHPLAHQFSAEGHLLLCLRRFHQQRHQSEERTGRRMRPSRRSKSEGPPTRYGGSDLVEPFQSEYRLQYSKIMAARQQQQEQQPVDTMTSSFPPPFRPASSRISTEYRLQFAWPKPPPTKEAPQPPRKSLSMGALRAHAPVPVHHHAAPQKVKRPDEHRATASELEPLVDAQHADVLDAGNEDKILEETLEKPKKRKEFKSEYKKRFRPFSNYEYVDGGFMKRRPEADLMVSESIARDSPVPEVNTPSADPWYNEVIELRKKAGEYKHRGWGTELVPEHLVDLYGKQVVLWEQVSRRSSLSALSLASATPRSISKEEKEKENCKKSSPTKGLTRFPGRADRVDGVARNQVDKGCEDKRDSARSRKEFLVRHHLERTTGAEDGALLVSPTREKLEPAMPRRKEEDSSNKSPSKSSPKSSPRSARSQSVGPLVSENRSPKRQPRTPVSTSSAASTAPKASAPTERRPRPTSLNTSSATRSKSSSVAMRNTSEDKTIGKSAKNAAQSGPKSKRAEPVKKQPPPPAPKKDDDKTSGVDTCDGGAASTSSAQQDLPAVHTQKPTPPSAGGSETKEIPPADELLSPDTNNTVSLIDDEPLVKSPPEPTRVKSPEQIIMRSPEPVNWTVPLDTGKTFTVTQNVREVVPQASKAARGELSRPHGESSRHWGAPVNSLEVSFDKVEGPPEIGVADAAQVVLNGDGADSSDHSEATPPTQKSAALVLQTAEAAPAIKSVAGTTLKRLDDPDLEPAPSSSSSAPYTVLEAPEVPLAPVRSSGYRILEAPEPIEAPSARSVASDVLEKARNRFDKFWGKDANNL
ncbi:nuclear protein MDM1 isoform X3 [Neocloeon triangulifer]|uniref:nuclear protein MDM1 isoform X3 n=1 Tax=Neocloeon triangulifer TaxID=2078957 RepID=UPI00286F8DC8|nr:nuclear protein MDM1 isoform X3 [Neocloeon triangulifer]